MKSFWNFLTSAIVITSSFSVRSQGTFLNLDFESATITPVQGGQYGGHVVFSSAFPGWVGYLGTNQATQALQNNYALGAANISILGPDWSFIPPIIEGQYTAMLQAGQYDGNVSTAIAQTAVIPLAANSVQLKTYAALAMPWVTIDGQDIALVPLSVTATYTLYGGDIAMFAGQTRELRIAAPYTPPASFAWVMVDSIQFSTEPIPEPSTLGLFALGALLLGWRLVLRSRQS